MLEVLEEYSEEPINAFLILKKMYIESGRIPDQLRLWIFYFDEI